MQKRTSNNHEIVATETYGTSRSCALVGCGQWGRNLLSNLQEIDALYGVADSDLKRRQWLSNTHRNLICESDYRKLLDNRAVKAVVVATPAVTHYRVVRDALLAGKDVFVEKPLALSSMEGLELVQLAEKYDRVLMVGHLLLYQPAIHRIRQLIEEGRIGALQELHQKRFGSGPIREVENVLWCLGSHDLAVQLYLLGKPPQKVRCHRRFVQQHRVEDDVHLFLEYLGGIRTHLHVSWVTGKKCRQLSLRGTAGTLVYDEVEQTLSIERKSAAGAIDREIILHGHPRPLTLELMEFLRCVEDRQPPLSDGRDALKVIELIETAMASDAA